MCTNVSRVLLFLAPVLCLAVAAPDATAQPSLVDFYGAPAAGAAPLEVHFHYLCDESVASKVASWSWDFGDGDSSAEDYTSHTYEVRGTYTVKLTVTVENGQTHTTTKEGYIVVDGAPAPVEEPEDRSETESPSTEDTEGEYSEERAGDGLVFIHHSCGENWLNSGLHAALLAKPYIGARNDITYGVDVDPDSGRPDSLEPVPGDLTDMHHWVLWFNDYLEAVRNQGADMGGNRIVMFKSCFPNSHVDDDGSEPGDPFSDWKTVSNYRAVFRHPSGPGSEYSHNGHAYMALEDVFAANPGTLFIVITAPPECWQESDAQCALRAREFNDWLKGEWVTAYIQRTGLYNVAVFDWFDTLASPNSGGPHANQLRGEYGGDAGDSHPNDMANSRSTRIFVSDADSFLDRSWARYQARSGR